MLIGGLQKLTLVDYPGKIASVVFTKGCLFRCPYCHNPDLVLPERGEVVPEDEVKGYLLSRVGFIEGVTITGGEPTLHKDLPGFISFLKGAGFLVKLDTNGVNPQMVSDLISEKKVDYIAMDLKNVWGKYQAIANLAPGKERFADRCRETFSLIQRSGIPHEWRTTILPGVHKKEDFKEMASYLAPGEQYFIQDINYRVTLNSNLDRATRLRAEDIIPGLHASYPELLIAGR